MKPLGTHNYFVYILINYNRTVLYTGMTNDLNKRWSCYLYWEHFTKVDDAILREKQIKGWIRKKKIDLISEFNPNWDFLNEKI